jgi:pSer/pThr/pTyr-binding forkhead associated (FHA) protein
MPSRITLTATDGPCKGREFVFTTRTVCTVGRSDACLLRIHGDSSDMTVSRRHCLLDIDPPTVRVRDLGSLNGTFVNDRNIGHRQQDTLPSVAVPAEPEGVELHAGDRLVVGTSEFRIGIQDSAAEWEPSARAASGDEDGPVRAGAAWGPSCAAGRQ